MSNFLQKSAIAIVFWGGLLLIFMGIDAYRDRNSLCGSLRRYFNDLTVAERQAKEMEFDEMLGYCEGAE
jgi:hypothetical protein